MDKEKMMSDYDRTREVILSCDNWEQLKVGVRMFNLLNKLHDIPEKDLNKLENLIGLMRMKCGDKEISEETSKIGKEFRKYAGQAGLNDIVFSEEEFVGGEADNMTPEDLAKKHDVDIKDIKKEIGIGTQIEKEHTDDDAVAREIAMDHIAEYSDYYTNDNFGIVAIENARGEGRKRVRISKEQMEELHKEGKLDLEGISLSYPEDVAEATSAAGSSGSYVGIFSKGKEQPVRRNFADVPVTNNGIVGKRQTGLPIGKIYSFNEDKEIIEEDDIEEAVSYAGAVGSYDTSGFADSEFMGTGKGSGKKGSTHSKTAYPGGKFVKIKDRCRKFPYCNQSPEAIKLYSENKVFNESRILKTVKKSNLKIKK
jgi:hypothetical protein